MTSIHPWKKIRIYLIITPLTTFHCGCAETTRSQAPVSVSSPAAAVSPSPIAPLVKMNKPADWCQEHGVPESQCTRCNKDLIAEFQKKGDWCASHGLPESQCIQCDPKRAETLKALQPKADSAP